MSTHGIRLKYWSKSGSADPKYPRVANLVGEETVPVSEKGETAMIHLKRRGSLIVLLIAFALVIAACSSSDSTETTVASATETTVAAATETTVAAATTTAAATETTVAASDVGTADNPIQILFVPSVSAEEIIAGGEILQSVLEEATGLSYEVSVPTSYAATVNEMCAGSDNTIGFIPATAYVLGNDLCDIDVALKSLRFGFTEYWAEFIVPRDSEATTIADLAGLKWAYPDAGSTSGFLVPSGMFKQDGIEPGESFEAGGHSATVRAVYNGEADFGTVFYSPSIDAEDAVLWDGTTVNADVPADLVDSCELDADGEIDCGGVFPRDARRNIREEAADVIQKVKIIELSQPIPNDTVSFSPDLPQDIREKFIGALIDFAANDNDQFKVAFDPYSWGGLELTEDSEFDFIRSLIQDLGITVDDL
jgi:phosphonate transport system substrate-binding protein